MAEPSETERAGRPALRRIVWGTGGVFALLIAAVLAVTALVEARRLGEVDRTLDALAHANVLLDDLDRERSEAIYVSAWPEADPAEFNRRVETSRTTRATMNAALFSGDADPVASEPEVQSARTALNGLDALRAQVGERALAPDAVARSYTGIIDELIAIQSTSLASAWDYVSVIQTCFHHDRLREATGGATVILIASRPSTVLLADRVVVLDEGRVVEEGAHEALLACSPRYRRLLGMDREDGDG